ncbi:copper chaperone PCu(A)C [Halomonas cerina]|uniref:Copper chaperone PCu(A)C n=1 Tax=Halomonas cerina TaxID=447424 RepID=A0A839VAT4_9GAMM|nr:copper chaperone PCu(A)C [Halomonas cerina]MBB3189616.1 hypothetical protein [Halomonas cerina]
MRLSRASTVSLASLALGLTGQVVLAQSLIVDEARVRAVPPGSPATAAFMELTNPGEVDLAVVGASSPLAGTLELHRHAMEEGVMQMRRVAAIPVPAGETTRLAPGGWHLMMFELTTTPAEGENVELTLSLDNGERLTLQVPVRRVQPMGMQEEDKHSPRAEATSR